MAGPTVPDAPRPAKASGIRLGTNKGHVVERRDVAATRQARKKSQPSSKKAKNVRELIREVCGLSPYEKKLLDTIKVMGSSADKKIYKMAKKRLGTHKRAMKKREEIKELNMKSRQKGN